MKEYDRIFRLFSLRLCILDDAGMFLCIFTGDVLLIIDADQKQVAKVFF